MLGQRSSTDFEFMALVYARFRLASRRLLGNELKNRTRRAARLHAVVTVPSRRTVNNVSIELDKILEKSAKESKFYGLFV